MLESVFISLSGLLYQSVAVVVGASFLWGALSVVVSPCHLGSIPLIVAFVNGQPKVDTRRAFFISLVFSLGIIVSISIIGIITGLAGRIIGDIGNVGLVVAVIVFFVVGLNFLGLFSFPELIQVDKHKMIKSEGYLFALLLGLLFGFAMGPCTFAFMAPILVISFNSAANSFFYSVILVAAYAFGHSLVFVIFGTSSTFAKKLLRWDNSSGGTEKVKKVIGAIIIFTAFYIAFRYIRF